MWWVTSVNAYQTITGTSEEFVCLSSDVDKIKCPAVLDAYACLAGTDSMMESAIIQDALLASSSATNT